MTNVVAVPKDAGEAEARIIEGLSAFAEGGKDRREEWRALAVQFDLDRKWLEDGVAEAEGERARGKAAAVARLKSEWSLDAFWELRPRLTTGEAIDLCPSDKIEFMEEWKAKLETGEWQPKEPQPEPLFIYPFLFTRNHHLGLTTRQNLNLKLCRWGQRCGLTSPRPGRTGTLILR